MHDAGFTNIRDFPLHDMDRADGYAWKEGALASIMVAGEDYTFGEDAGYFDPSTPIMITYHSLTEEAAANRKAHEAAARKAREGVELRKLFEYHPNAGPLKIITE